MSYEPGQQTGFAAEPGNDAHYFDYVSILASHPTVHQNPPEQAPECSVRNCQELSEPPNKMCAGCREKHRKYATTKRARRKQEKAAASGLEFDAGSPSNAYMPKEPAEPYANASYNLASVSRPFAQPDPWAGAIDPRLTSSELAGALTPLPTIFPTGNVHHHNLQPFAEPLLPPPPPPPAAVPPPTKRPRLSLPPNTEEAGPSGSAARYCSVKGCHIILAAQYPFKMCEPCRNRYREYGITKRRKWKEDRVAYEHELEGLLAQEEERRQAEGLPPLADSPDEFLQWQQSVVNEKVDTEGSLGGRLSSIPVDTGRVNSQVISSSLNAPHMCTVSHCHKVLPATYRYKRCEQHRYQNRHHSQLKRVREKEVKIAGPPEGAIGEMFGLRLSATPPPDNQDEQSMEPETPGPSPAKRTASGSAKRPKSRTSHCSQDDCQNLVAPDTRWRMCDICRRQRRAEAAERRAEDEKEIEEARDEHSPPLRQVVITEATRAHVSNREPTPDSTLQQEESPSVSLKRKAPPDDAEAEEEDTQPEQVPSPAAAPPSASPPPPPHEDDYVIGRDPSIEPIPEPPPEPLPEPPPEPIPEPPAEPAPTTPPVKPPPSHKPGATQEAAPAASTERFTAPAQPPAPNPYAHLIPSSPFTAPLSTGYYPYPYGYPYYMPPMGFYPPYMATPTTSAPGAPLPVDPNHPVPGQPPAPIPTTAYPFPYGYYPHYGYGGYPYPYAPPKTFPPLPPPPPPPPRQVRSSSKKNYDETSVDVQKRPGSQQSERPFEKAQPPPPIPSQACQASAKPSEAPSVALQASSASSQVPPAEQPVVAQAPSVPPQGIPPPSQADSSQVLSPSPASALPQGSAPPQAPVSSQASGPTQPLPPFSHDGTHAAVLQTVTAASTMPSPVPIAQPQANPTVPLPAFPSVPLGATGLRLPQPPPVEFRHSLYSTFGSTEGGQGIPPPLPPPEFDALVNGPLKVKSFIAYNPEQARNAGKKKPRYYMSVDEEEALHHLQGANAAGAGATSAASSSSSTIPNGVPSSTPPPPAPVLAGVKPSTAFGDRKNMAVEGEDGMDVDEETRASPPMVTRVCCTPKCTKMIPAEVVGTVCEKCKAKMRKIRQTVKRRGHLEPKGLIQAKTL
ncbi:hypothetical protein CYLTODRAFT_493965, partial [Cylindrobasidium torrendii FP15055 ss-10]